MTVRRGTTWWIAPLAAVLLQSAPLVLRADDGTVEAQAPAADVAPETGAAPAQDSATDSERKIGDDVEAVLDDAAATRVPLFRYRPLVRVRKAWHRVNDRLEERLGLRFGVTFTTLIQHAPTVGNPNDDFVGTVDLLGRWTLIDHKRWGRGTLNAQVRHRDNWGAATGNDLSTNIGLPWSVYASGSDSFTQLNQLYWTHELLGDALTITIGRIDLTDFFDRNRVASSSSKSFLGSPLVNSQTISFPSNGSGLNVAYQVREWLGLSIGFGDAAGDPSKPPELSGAFDSGVFGATEVTVRRDLGTLAAPLGVGSFRLMGWHTDDTGTAKVGTGAKPNREGRGVAFNADQEIGERWLAFVRTGHSPDAGLRTETELSLGVGARRPFGRASDFAGLGWTWADALGSSEDQYAVEAFYRAEVLDGVEISPDVQFLFDPVLSDANFAIVFGVRMRVVF